MEPDKIQNNKISEKKTPLFVTNIENKKNNPIIVKFQKIEKKEEGNISSNINNSQNYPKINIKSNLYKKKVIN